MNKEQMGAEQSRKKSSITIRECQISAKYTFPQADIYHTI